MKKTLRAIKRLLLLVLALALFVVIATAGINIHVCSAASKYMLSPEAAGELTDVDCILVLGCAVWPGNTPSPMLADRLSCGVELYAAGAAPKIIVSGDHSQPDYDEVGVMRQYCLDAGVPEEDIFMDHAGLSTYDSVYRARDIFQAEKVIIVTQEYHLYRAVYAARALGLEAYGVSCDRREYSGQLFRDAREVLARVKDFGYVLLGAQPEHLGEPIPVSGDGRATIG